VPQLGITIPAPTLLRFWTMLAHYHGGIWNAAEAARSLGVTEPTARRYLDILTGLFMARQLRPWHQNLQKRQVKSPKVYLRDSGLLHTLLGLATEREVLSHPKVGASCVVAGTASRSSSRTRRGSRPRCASRSRISASGASPCSTPAIGATHSIGAWTSCRWRSSRGAAPTR
jgi:hypothetical protein